MPVIPREKFIALQHQARQLRNICILAHVDHGKTTLADSLLATNGIVSAKLAGRVRYLDSRPDEQERGITMKSSAVALYFAVRLAGGADGDVVNQREFLVNVIDSPGHVDFASEVSVASRLCDGALLLVDVVEGVCTQTFSVLRRAFADQLRPVLVLNKMDRLIIELKMTPAEAYLHLRGLLEQVNAFWASLAQEENVRLETRRYEQQQQGVQAGDLPRSTVPEEAGNQFRPETGNVLFASAVDGWAFRVGDFTRLYSAKMEVADAELRRGLWGEFTFDAKTKSVRPLSEFKNRQSLFVQLVLQQIWTVYDSVMLNPDPEKTEKIVGSLNLKTTPFELRSKDRKAVLRSLMTQWLPLATATLLSIVELIPSPVQSQPKKMTSLFYQTRVPSESLPETRQLEVAVGKCQPADEEPVVAVIAKLVSYPKSELPREHKADAKSVLTREQLKQRRAALEAQRQEQGGGIGHTEQPEPEAHADSSDVANDDVLIGFARIFSGMLKRGQKVYMLSPGYDPMQTADATPPPQITVDQLFLLLGRDLEPLEEVGAGNVFGIMAKDTQLRQWSTLSSSLHCPSLGGTANAAEQTAVVRVAVEPADPSQLPQLIEGLKRLHASDAAVDVVLQQTGEHVLCAAGELHLERCIRDLKERFAKIDIHVSPPIVPYRETIYPKPDGGESVVTAFRSCELAVRAVPLSAETVRFIHQEAPKIRQIIAEGQSGNADDRVIHEDAAESLADSVKAMKISDSQRMECLRFLESISKVIQKHDPSLAEYADKIWSLGPRRCGANILFNGLKDYDREPWVLGDKALNDHSISRYDSNVIAGFQMASAAGPLCAEPMQGVAFIVERFTNKTDQDSENDTGMAGQIITAVKDSCRSAFLKWSPRLMLAMYSCEIQTVADALGKVYGVLSKRRGRIIAEEMKDDTSFFLIKSVMPVVESFGFSEEIRKKTSGAAQPQLIFSGWEVLDQDPFWVPKTAEELEDLGDKADKENVAKRYMDGVRKRKGMLVEEKLVAHAEKQRTLKIK